MRVWVVTLDVGLGDVPLDSVFVLLFPGDFAEPDKEQIKSRLQRDLDDETAEAFGEGKIPYETTRQKISH